MWTERDISNALDGTFMRYTCGTFVARRVRRNFSPDYGGETHEEHRQKSSDAIKAAIARHRAAGLTWGKKKSRHKRRVAAP